MADYKSGENEPWYEKPWAFYAIATGLTLLPLLGGFGGAIFTSNNIDNWYALIQKPDWRPPNWAFGPVWTFLYLSMGFASYLIWRDDQGTSRVVNLSVYAANLLVNWIWTPIFFGWHQVRSAFYVIILLDVIVVSMCVLFFRINKIAGALIIPYIIWLGLATCLNWSIWQLNGPNPEPVVPTNATVVDRN